MQTECVYMDELTDMSVFRRHGRDCATMRPGELLARCTLGSETEHLWARVTQTCARCQGGKTAVTLYHVSRTHSLLPSLNLTRTHAHTHTQTPTHTQTHIHTYAHMCKQAHIHTHSLESHSQWIPKMFFCFHCIMRSVWHWRLGKHILWTSVNKQKWYNKSTLRGNSIK